MPEQIACPHCGRAEDVTLCVRTAEFRPVLSVDRSEPHHPFDCEEPEDMGDCDSDRVVDADGHPLLNCNRCCDAWFEPSIVCSGLVLAPFDPQTRPDDDLRKPVDRALGAWLAWEGQLGDEVYAELVNAMDGMRADIDLEVPKHEPGFTPVREEIIA